MEKFIFTFPENHPFKDHYQPVFAESGILARRRMVQRYGRDWGFQYTEEQAFRKGIPFNKRELCSMTYKE